MEGNSDSYTIDELKLIFDGAVSPDVFGKIAELDPPLRATVEEGEALAFFADVREATELRGSYGPQGAMRKIIKFLDGVGEITRELGGYVVLYEGDAVMTLFGAPIAAPAQECALAAARLSDRAKEHARALGLSINCGYDWGKMVLGCLTPRSRPSYTAFGVHVNRAVRMVDLTRRSGGIDIVSSVVRDLLEPTYRTVYFDTIEAKNEPHGLDIYAVVGPRDTMSQAESDVWDRYDQAMSLHRNAEPEESLRQLTSLAGERPDDILISDSLARIRQAYAVSLRARFNDAPDIAGLISALVDATSLLFLDSRLAIIDPGLDAVWRFHEDARLVMSPVVLAQDGAGVIWLRGLTGASNLDQAPDPLRSLGFYAAASMRKNNQLAAVLLLSTRPEADLAAFEVVADILADPWTRHRTDDLRMRYREKVDDAEKLQEVNRELEAQSVKLSHAVEEIGSLNKELEKRVREHALRLERASTLKRYLPPSVVEDIIDGRRELAPRTERRKLTILFSDVRGFTSATDGLEPEELERLLDEYLSLMSEIAFSAGATIDKFRGDGMMVFFGAPDPVEPKEGAIRCVRMAVEMCEAIERLRAKWYEEGYDWDLGVRIGINTGYATVGEFGSQNRLDYTAIGTEVNLAARLEGACDTDSIIVSHSTWALVRDEYTCVPRNTVELKGIHRPVRIYEIAWREE